MASHRASVDQLTILDLLEQPSAEALLKPDQIYASDDPALIARLTEDNRYDRKSAGVQSNALAVAVSASGNGPSIYGGVIAVGIRNDRAIEGCKHLNEARLQEIERAGGDRCPLGRFETRRIPTINLHGEDDFIILIRIHYVEGRLVELTDGSSYIRDGDRCKRLSDNEKAQIRIDKGERAFELEPCGLPIS